MRQRREQEGGDESDGPLYHDAILEPNFHSGAAAVRGAQAGVENLLGEQADAGPGGITLAGENELGELREQGGLLRTRGVAAGFLDLRDVTTFVEIDLTAVHDELGACEAVARLLSEEREDEVGDLQEAFRAADDGPLRMLGDEGAVIGGADSACEIQCAGECERHWRSIGALLRLGMDASGDAERCVLTHGPKGEAQAIPTEIAQTAERLKCAVSTDVGVRKIIGGEKAELSGDVLD